MSRSMRKSYSRVSSDRGKLHKQGVWMLDISPLIEYARSTDSSLIIQEKFDDSYMLAATEGLPLACQRYQRMMIPGVEANHSLSDDSPSCTRVLKLTDSCRMTFYQNPTRDFDYGCATKFIVL